MHNQAFQIFSHKNIHCLLCFCPFSTAFRTAFYLAVLCYFFLGKSIIPVAFSTAIGGTLGVTGEDGPAFLTESAFVWKNKDKINLIRLKCLQLLGYNMFLAIRGSSAVQDPTSASWYTLFASLEIIYRSRSHPSTWQSDEPRNGWE